jgi:hypothetical protein
MSETWIGLLIGGSALGIAVLMVIGHYRRERKRAQMLRDLSHRVREQQTRE